jgi:hypothetical protein
MIGRFQKTICLNGTLAANVVEVCTVPADCSLVHVSAVGSNASDATIKVGTTSDDDAYLTAQSIGDSSVPAEFDRDDFVGTQYPHISDGTVVKVTVDYDGDGGTAVADLSVVLTFTEG